MWEYLKFIAMTIGFFTIGLTFFWVGMVIVQAIRENRAYERANARLDRHIRKSWGE